MLKALILLEINRLTEDKIEKSKAPLESLAFLRRSLEDTAVETEAAQTGSRSHAVPETIQHVTSKRGRKITMYSSLEISDL